jgi:photosystem II stability/assembly factor-like uncharacterized protein
MIVHVATGQDWTWKPANGPYGGPVRALVTNVNGLIFAGTETRGVFVSEDHGAVWKKTGLDSMMISDLAVDSLGSILAVGPDQLYRTADGGSIWTGLLPPGMAVAPTCIEVDGNQRLLLGTTKGFYWSTNNGVQWTTWKLPAARVASATVTPSGAWLVGMSSHMYRSTDEGASWAATESTFTPTAFSTSASDTLLAGSDLKGFFVSGDDGATWSLRVAAEGKTITRITGWKPDTLFAAVQPLDPSIAGGVMRSTDGGATWSQWGLVHTSVYDLIVDGQSDLFAGAYHGAFSSPGAGSEWQPRNNKLANVTVSVLTAPSATEVLAGTNVGMFYSPDEGMSWINAFPELTTGAVQAVASQGTQRFFFSSMLFSPLGGIYRSEDHGQTWDHVSGTTITGLYISIGGLLVTREQILLAGTSQGRIYRSTNWGDAWTRVDSASSTGGVKAMVSDSAGRLFLASASKGVYISTDAGLTWADRSAGMARKNLLSLVAKDSSLIFAGSTSGVLMRSHDAGLHWTSLTHGAPGNVHALAITSQGHLLASIGTILLRSTDDGDTWTADTSGLPAATYLAVTAASDSAAYVGADKQPVFRLSRTVTGIPPVSTRVPERVHLEQNFPNPFNPSTTIKFFLPARAMVRLTVWNMLGQRVAVVRDEQMDAGQHECVFHAPGLASGVYFYRLEAGRFSETRRLLLLR